MNQEKFLISVDWCQYYCDSHGHFPIAGCFYQSKRKNPHGYQTTYEIAHVRDVMPSYGITLGVFLHGFCLAIFGMYPRSSVVDPMGVSVKVSNRALYTAEWAFYLHDILDTFGWEFRNISRLDLCYDCNRFRGGMLPSQLIQGYLNPHTFVQDREMTKLIVERPVVGVRSYAVKHPVFIRKGSNRFCCEGVKAGHETIFEYLRFGSHKSAVCAYIYNKSQEMRAVKEKPYIVAMWETVGLDVDNVWRVEISISSSGTWLRSKGEGCEEDETHNKILRLDHMAFVNICSDPGKVQARVEELFYIYAKEYFCFRLDEGQKRNKDMKVVLLFEYEIKITLKPRSRTQYLDTGRSEKMAINNIYKLNETYSDLSPNERSAIMTVLQLFIRVSAVKVNKRLHARDAYELLANFKAREWLQPWFRNLANDKAKYKEITDCYERLNTLVLDYVENKPEICSAFT